MTDHVCPTLNHPVCPTLNHQHVLLQPTEEFAHLPVMVFLHGGGHMSGGAMEYPPHVLLNHEIVLVVVQYRLGMLGISQLFLNKQPTS